MALVLRARSEASSRGAIGGEKPGLRREGKASIAGRQERVDRAFEVSVASVSRGPVHVLLRRPKKKQNQQRKKKTIAKQKKIAKETKKTRENREREEAVADWLKILGAVRERMVVMVVVMR